MNVKLLLVFPLFAFQSGFSQTEKLLKGVVSSDNFLLYNVDVINKTSKEFTKTNENGEFAIVVNASDSLFFYSKEFNLKKLKISSSQMELDNLQVLMSKKAEELEEVLVTKTNKVKLSLDTWHEQSKRDEITSDKNPYTEHKIVMVRGRTFVNGLNFAAIGKKLLGLFSKEKEPKNEDPQEIEFETLAKNTCDQKFFTENLKLKPEDVELFLQFCAVDPESKKLNSQTNILEMMDFLSIKNNEFQKIK
jgi:hypothetical protein